MLIETRYPNTKVQGDDYLNQPWGKDKEGLELQCHWGHGKATSEKQNESKTCDSTGLTN